MDDTTRNDPDQPVNDAGTLGHLAEDTGLSDEQLSEETGTGLDDSADPGGTAGSAFPPD